MRRLKVSCIFVVGMFVLGCGGSDKITIPTDKLTAEQEAKIKLEDKKVDDEESQGKKK